MWTSAASLPASTSRWPLIGEDLGESIARRTAQQLVVYHLGLAGRSQFSALRTWELRRDVFAPLLEFYSRESLATPRSGSARRSRLHEPAPFAARFHAEPGSRRPGWSGCASMLLAPRSRVVGVRSRIRTILRFRGHRAHAARFPRMFGTSPSALET